MADQGVPKERFVLGLDLDGVCADFYDRLRKIASEWFERPIEELTKDVSYGLPEWGILGGEDYERLHRFAVTQRELFKTMHPIPGAVPAIRNLSIEEIRIRIITHRLFIPHFHETAVTQTTNWLDTHGIRYWDLCFMRDKEAVNADLYVEDTPNNVRKLVTEGKEVIVFTNSTNAKLDFPGATRANDWAHAEGLIRDKYYLWLDTKGYERPPGPGMAPSWATKRL